jgi:hypothetical protein
MNTQELSEKATSAFGLIAEYQIDHIELHGFEVDMIGQVIVPEFHPRRFPTGALPAIMAFTSELLSATENAA